jgi:hypothetical protein
MDEPKSDEMPLEGADSVTSTKCHSFALAGYVRVTLMSDHTARSSYG